jgi:hypothetical protein
MMPAGSPGAASVSIGQSGNLEVEIDAVEPRILAPPKRDMPSKSSSSVGFAVLDRERVPADLRHVITTGCYSASRGARGLPFGSLAGDNALRRPSDVFVLTAAEWRAPEGTALYREVVMHGIRFRLPS